MNIFKCLIRWAVEPDLESNLATAQVVVALDGPGSDRRKAEIALSASICRSGLPLILQGDVARHISAHGINNIRLVIGAEPGEYLDTYAALSLANEFCIRNGWRRVILVAHPDHLFRAKAIAEVLGLTVLIPKETVCIRYSKAGDEKRDTIYGRHKFLFRPREVAARMRDLYRGII